MNKIETTPVINLAEEDPITIDYKDVKKAGIKSLIGILVTIRELAVLLKYDKIKLDYFMHLAGLLLSSKVTLGFIDEYLKCCVLLKEKEARLEKLKAEREIEEFEVYTPEVFDEEDKTCVSTLEVQNRKYINIPIK